MMTLIRLNLRALFSRMFLRSRTAKKRSPIVTVLIALLAIYVIVAFLGWSGFMFYSICDPLFSSGYGWLYFSLMGIIVFGLCFVGSIFAAQNQLFSAKDNDLLLALPIKPRDILIGRITALLMLEYLFEIFIALPAFIIWCISQPVTVIGIVFFIIAVLVLPLCALAFASFFAWIIALITARMRNKNLITMVLSLLFLFLYFRVFSNVQKSVITLIANGAQIAEAIHDSVFPAYHLGIAIANGNILSMLIFVLCAVLPFVLAVLLLSVNFIRIATTNPGAAKIKYVRKTLKASGIRTAFVFKELRHFLSNPMYIMNTALGGVFMLVGAVMVAIKRETVLDLISSFTGSGISLSPAVLVGVGLSLVGGLNLVSAPSISLEGKNLWISKSLPVRPYDVLLSKAMMHTLVCGTPAVLSSLICSIFLKVTSLEFVIILFLPLLFTIFTGLLGVVINLQFPKFDWINEIQPIKQGLATLLTMFGSVAIAAALIILYALLARLIMSAQAYMLLCVLLFMAVSTAFIHYLKKGGSRRFEALNND